MLAIYGGTAAAGDVSGFLITIVCAVVYIILALGDSHEQRQRANERTAHWRNHNNRVARRIRKL